jgi:uncharacterized membrane protein
MAMTNPEDSGFVTLHRGRTPLLLRIALVLLVAFSWVVFWKITNAHAQYCMTSPIGSTTCTTEPVVHPWSGGTTSGAFNSGAISTGTLSATSIIQGKCAAGRVPVIVGSDMWKPCEQNVCLVVYKCAIPADLTDQE